MEELRARAVCLTTVTSEMLGGRYAIDPSQSYYPPPLEYSDLFDLVLRMAVEQMSPKAA